ncbi:MAG TPA: THUMP domain-containing protein [Nitrososphaera sp.]|nr:THUMP domain-containing protein [Nitrososphaera sp.]
MKQFNLIVSTFRFREEEAQDEALDLLESFGDPEAICEITEIKGILLAQTSIEPTEVVDKLKKITASEPWQVRYILRVLPVMRVVPTELDGISAAASEFGDRIGPEESFRITVEKRHTSLESMEIITAIASRIQRKVNLENPDWLILVQILGAKSGVSVLRPEQLFSSVVEKRREEGRDY